MAASSTRMVCTLALMVGCPACLSTRIVEKTRTVRVVTEPAGALVWKKDDGDRYMLGRAPLRVDLGYQQVTTRLDLLSWAIPAVGGALCAGGIWLAATGDLETVDARGGGGVAMALAGGGVALTSLLINLLYYRETGTKQRATPTTIGATMEGYQDAWRVVVATDARDSLRFELPQKGRHPASPPSGSAVASRRAIVAVFDLKGAGARLSPRSRRILTDYLGVQLAAGARFRVVPPTQVRERLVRTKRESYRDCYDVACQIELGQALAADKILSSKIVRAGDRCRLTAVLYDLRTESSDSAVAVDAACDMGALGGAIERAARDLSHPAGASDSR